MKAIIQYPYTVIGTVEIDLSDTENIEQLATDISKQVDFINEHTPSYENTYLPLCDGARLSSLYYFKIFDDQGEQVHY